MALFDSVRDGFADRNAPLHLLLGVISLARRLDAFLPAPSAPPPAPPAPAPAGDPFLYLVLGVISLRRTLEGELAKVRAAHRGAPPAEAPEAAAKAAPLIRDLLR
jgi:hypothetical protein